jgi:hypothetical protein
MRALYAPQAPGFSHRAGVLAPQLFRPVLFDRSTAKHSRSFISPHFEQRLMPPERSLAREQLRLVLGAVVDEVPADACQRVLLVMRGAAKRELDRLHAHDGQLELDSAA